MKSSLINNLNFKLSVLSEIAKMGDLKEIIMTMNENMSRNFEEVKREIKGIMTKTTLNSERITAVERDLTKKNLILFGLEERKQNYWELEEVVIGILRKLVPGLSENDIDFIYRIGKKNEKVRPIKIGVMALRKKLQILQNKKILKGTKLYIEEDLPMEIRTKNKSLIPAMLEARREDKIAYIKNGELVVKERKSNITLATDLDSEDGNKDRKTKRVDSGETELERVEKAQKLSLNQGAIPKVVKRQTKINKEDDGKDKSASSSLRSWTEPNNKINEGSNGELKRWINSYNI